MDTLLTITAFPRALEVDRLTNLLAEPLATKICSNSVALSNHEFFTNSEKYDDVELATFINTSMSQSVMSKCSEMVWCGWWDSFFLRSFVSLAIKYSLLLNVEYDRNVQDASITIAEKKRDYNLWVNGLLVVAGEDKASNDLRESIDDLAQKNKGN